MSSERPPGHKRSSGGKRQGQSAAREISAGGVVVRGEHTFDVRHFNLEPPTTVALKIYPDVVVELHLEGRTQ